MKPFFAPERLETPRFILRCWMPGDGRRLHEAQVSSYAHLKQFMDWAKDADSLPVDESEVFVRNARARWLLNEDFTLGIFDRDESQVLGGTGFHLREGPITNGAVEAGLWIRSDASGKGLGTAVLVELLKWGFDAWPWHRISWRASDANEASIALATRAGLEPEGMVRQNTRTPDGTRRDTVLFAALKDEWRPPAD
jgi:RimJ/RimL family protein N-acetyltransferase